MAIKMPPIVAKPIKPANTDERAEAFISGAAAGAAPRQPTPPVADNAPGRTVVNGRWDTELLKRIDKAAKQQGISRTAWLHVAAAEKLSR